MELNLKELIYLIFKKWWLVLLCTLLIGGSAWICAINFMVPVYKADTTMYVGKNADEMGVNATDLNIGTAVVLDYREIAKSRLVASTVINELGLTGISVDDLVKRINVEQKTETRVIEISVYDYSPEMAMIITNKVAEVFQKKITEIMQIKNVQVIDKAEIPLDSSSLSNKVILVIGLLIGFIIGIAIVFMLEYFNNTVRTPEDLKKYTGLPVIGTIPAFAANRKEV